jgi:hypothetical protein
LGPEPWKALGQDPDEHVCCNSTECGCGGDTWREHLLSSRGDMPPLEYTIIESREVTLGKWMPNARPRAEAGADSVQADVGRCCGNCLHFRLIDLARIPHGGTTPPRGGRCIVGRIAPDGETCCGTWTANDQGERLT